MIKAIFIGSNSCGFIHGQIYQIRTKCCSSSADNGYLYVYDIASHASCPYDSLESMLNNWSILSYDPILKCVSHKERKGYALKNKIHVRYGPSLICSQTGILHQDDECTIEEDTDGWFKIVHKSLEGETIRGWIQKKYITTYQR